MASEEEKILSIKVDYEQAIKAIADYQSKIDDLKQSEKELKQQLQDGQISQQQYREEMAVSRIKTQQYTESIRVLSKEVNNNIKQDRAKVGSLKGLRAELSNLTAQYDSLSAEERENEQIGGLLAKQINKLTSEVKGAEEATGRYNRNVGNYENAIKSAMASTNPFVATLVNTASSADGVKGSFMQAAAALGNMTKAALAFIATPLGAILTVIAGAILLVTKGISSSEEQMNRWRIVIAPLRVVLDGLTNVITWLSDKILILIESGGKMLGWVNGLLEKIPVLGDAIKELNQETGKRVELTRAQIAYEKAVRAEIVASAEREREISELRAKVAQKDQYTAAQRVAFLDEAIKKEKEQAEARKRLAEMNLEALELEGSLTENDADMNNRLAEAKAAVIRADTDLNNKTRELNSQRAEAINQMKAEAKAAEEAALKRMEEAAKRSSGMSDEDFNKAYKENERLAFSQIAMAKSVQETKANINKLMLKDAYATAMDEIKIQEEKANALRVVSGSIIELMEAVGDSNKAAAIAAKIVALAQIAIDTGVAISKAVATSAGKGFWGFLAEVGPYIATITTNMATAIKSVKSAKFSTGGDVSGAGTSTSDSIPAMLSDGESVITAKATSMFAPILSAFNQAGGGVPIYGQQAGNQAMGEDMLAKSFAKGLADMPAPVVSVEEINSVGNRVKVIENLNRI